MKLAASWAALRAETAVSMKVAVSACALVDLKGDLKGDLRAGQMGVLRVCEWVAQ